MADFDTSMYKLSNQANPVENYQKSLTAATDRAAEGYKLSDMAIQNQQNQQAFQDQQSARQALKQNVDPTTGQLNIPHVLNQMRAQNPMQAMQYEKMFNQYGIDGAAMHAQAMNQFYATTTRETYDKDKEGMRARGFNEVDQLPDQYQPMVMQKGLIRTSDAKAQMDLIKAQADRENALAKAQVEQGIVPQITARDQYGSVIQNGEEKNPQGRPSALVPPQYQNLPPGSTIPTAKKDMEAQKMAQQELGARQAGADYTTAKNNLLAAKNINSLLDPYKDDLNKFPNKMFGQLNSEIAKIAGGSAPTVEQLKSMDPNNIPQKYANFMSYVTGNPQSMNNGEILQLYKNYVDDLKQNSMENLATHYRAAQDVGQRAGMSPQTLGQMKADHARELNNLANSAPRKSSSAQPQSQRGWKSAQSPSAHPMDDVAVAWAKANPGPKADAILKANGVK